MDNPDKFTLALDELFAEFNSADISNSEFAPNKKRDADDNYLGTLPVRLQRLWVVKQKVQCELDEAVQNISDVIECLKSDIVHYGGEIPAWKLSDYSPKLGDLIFATGPLIKKWKALEDILHSFIVLIFESPPDMPIFGVRSGYKVCCRKNNSRNDIHNPLLPIIESFGLEHSLKVREEIVKVEFPKGTDLSKLSTKEILSAILRQMK
jgi:hypothetical protein